MYVHTYVYICFMLQTIAFYVILTFVFHFYDDRGERRYDDHRQLETTFLDLFLHSGSIAQTTTNLE